jgi:hypothetical protein
MCNVCLSLYVDCFWTVETAFASHNTVSDRNSSNDKTEVSKANVCYCAAEDDPCAERETITGVAIVNGTSIPIREVLLLQNRSVSST